MLLKVNLKTNIGSYVLKCFLLSLVKLTWLLDSEVWFGKDYSEVVQGRKPGTGEVHPGLSCLRSLVIHSAAKTYLKLGVGS